MARRLKKGVFEKIKETVFLAKIFSMKDEYLGQSGFTRSDLNVNLVVETNAGTKNIHFRKKEEGENLPQKLKNLFELLNNACPEKP